MVGYMNKYQKFFAELQEKLMISIYEIYDKEILELSKLQKKNKDTILQEIAYILLNYTIKDEILDLNAFKKVELKKKLHDLIDNTFKEEIAQEQDFAKDILNNVFKDKYYSNSYLYGLGISYTIKPVSDKVLKDIINKKIQEKMYLDRIGDNKNAVAKQVRIEVDRFLDGKTTVNQINTILTKKFNQNWYNTNRLVTNEIARVQEGANEVWREKHNIEKVLYSATLDMKTCSDCGAYDGEVYDNDKTVNLPRHIKCRCTYISLVREDWKPKFRLNNITKERITWQTFQEWKQKQNLN